MPKNKNGFSIVELLIVLVIIGFIGSAFLFVSGKNKSGGKASTANIGGPVQWEYDQQQAKWTASGTPPACPSPLFSLNPVNISLATGILYPGQYRGNSYKAQGGLRFDRSKSSDIEVRLPMDAKLVSAARYLENDELQYRLSFTNDCGITLRFDHLLRLPVKFKKITDKLPPAGPDDSRMTPISPAVSFKAGDSVATAVGHPSNHNISVDFGVYDLRMPNQISANPKWQDLHQTDKSLSWYGVCWLNLIPPADAAKIAALPPADPTSGTISDYCQTTAGTTIQ
jgi:prepilin-type N-terminal cleavage/methylation domain-containing protein